MVSFCSEYLDQPLKLGGLAEHSAWFKADSGMLSNLLRREASVDVYAAYLSRAV